MPDQELNLDSPEPQSGENKYALVRRAGDLPEQEWPDERINAIKRMHGENATSLAELATFLHVAARHDLDPALNEVYLIQTSRGPKVYAGRDGYLKAAARYDGYNGHQSGVVYTEDRCVIRAKGKDIEVQHEFSPNQDRGDLHGAYCVAYGESERPTVVYREFEKCNNPSSAAWRQHPDDMIENRAIASALRRQVPLGGLLIEGEHLDDERFLEDRVGQTTEQKLDDLEAELGIGDTAREDDEVQEPEVVQADVPDDEPIPDDSGTVEPDPDTQELRHKFLDFADRYGVKGRMVEAWAKHSDAIPNEPDEWNADHWLVALRAMRDTEGKELMTEYARYLIALDDDIGMSERLKLEEKLGAAPSRRELHQLIDRLEEREG